MPQSPHIESQIARAIDVLTRGGIVAYPTDTVYGLGADPFNERAVQAVFRAKRRPFHQPVPLLLPDAAAIERLATGLSDVALKLVSSFFPGALTLVVPSRVGLPAVVTAGTANVAVRVPDHDIPRRLATALGTAIVGTSANLTGRPGPLTAPEVRNQLGDTVDLIVDGGPCPGGVESTVIDCTGSELRVLREGAVSREVIEEAIGMKLRGHDRA